MPFKFLGGVASARNASRTERFARNAERFVRNAERSARNAERFGRNDERFARNETERFGGVVARFRVCTLFTNEYNLKSKHL